MWSPERDTRDYPMGGDAKMVFVAQLVNAMWSFVLADAKVWN